jgi:hypothetical protein
VAAGVEEEEEEDHDLFITHLMALLVARTVYR